MALLIFVLSFRRRRTRRTRYPRCHWLSVPTLGKRNARECQAAAHFRFVFASDFFYLKLLDGEGKPNK